MSFIIVDVEADGPIPAEFSMVCFGAVLVKDAYKATAWKKYRVTAHTHNPVDDARGNAEALKKFKELGLKI